MTAERAEAVAKAAAADEGWPWQDPVRVRRQRRWLFIGPTRWEVWTNADSLGSNVRVVIDDASGDVKEKHFLPR